MKARLFLSTLLLCAGLAGAQATYKALPAESSLTWRGHAEIGSYAPTGTIQLASGSFAFDGKHIGAGTFVVDMLTLAAQDATLQEHLRGADFFDVEKYKTATLVLTGVKASKAEGQLTIKGVAQPVHFPVKVVAEKGGLKITGTARIDRTAYGIQYNSTHFFSGLGDKAIADHFELAFSIVADKQ